MLIIAQAIVLLDIKGVCLWPAERFSPSRTPHTPQPLRFCSFMGQFVYHKVLRINCSNEWLSERTKLQMRELWRPQMRELWRPQTALRNIQLMRRSSFLFPLIRNLLKALCCYFVKFSQTLQKSRVCVGCKARLDIGRLQLRATGHWLYIHIYIYVWMCVNVWSCMCIDACTSMSMHKQRISCSKP